MNETNNSSENTLNNVPVQEAFVGEQNTSQPVETVAPAQPENVVQPVQSENNAESLPTSNNEKVNSDGGDKIEVGVSKKEEEVRNAKLRFPVIVSILVLFFAIFVIVYC